MANGNTKIEMFKGPWSRFVDLEKVETTFYYIEDTHQLYLGNVKISNAGDLTAAVSRIAVNETDISDIKSTLTVLQGSDSVSNSIRKIAKDAVDALDAQLANVAKSGAASDVFVADSGNKLTATNVEDALAEIVGMVEDATSVGQVSLTHAAQPDQGDSSTYILKQNNIEVGRIHLAKDMVATSGSIVYQDESGNSGTFIKLIIANSDPFYINVASLIEYNSVDSTSEVALSQDANHKITASLVAVPGSKITDGTVTKAKLASSVQASLDLADGSVQSVVEGGTNGTISVDGTNVAVHGLGSAAYTNSSAYDQAGAAATVKSEVMGSSATDTTSSKTIEGLVKKTNAINTLIGTLDTLTYDDVLDYVDKQIIAALTWQEF